MSGEPNRTRRRAARWTEAVAGKARGLLAALVVGLAALALASHHRAKERRAIPNKSERVVRGHASGLSASVISRPSASRGERQAAWAFARSYALYLEGSIGVRALVAATPAVRQVAADIGPIPAPLRSGWPRRMTVAPTHGTSRRDTVTVEDGDRIFRALITLAPKGLGWRVVTLLPPSYPTRRVRPAGAGAPQPPAAQAAAEAFLTTYVQWTYGQVSPPRVRACSTALLAELAGSPPRVPPSVRRLRPHLGNVWLEWGLGTDPWRGWAALAFVNDGQHSYPVAAKLERVDGHWLVVALLPPS